DILTTPEREAIRDALDNDEIWRDGGSTAAGAARAAKNNEQADPAQAAVKGVLAKIEKALRANETFMAATMPDQFARLIISRYAEGMEYGAHVDAPYINGARSDISFTLFLAEPDNYDGGELVVERTGHDDAVKGPAGSVVVYSSDSVHRVATVTRGARLACVGWIKSRVKPESDRETLFELASITTDLKAAGAPAETMRRLNNVRNNLLRRFGD
ncbi:MAG: Fe2+-dependent dioxygenase, partial [Marinicaulis sp.]|nr:Fe2+-dependent dioxygenase [Marinicaulis sp.]